MHQYALNKMKLEKMLAKVLLPILSISAISCQPRYSGYEIDNELAGRVVPIGIINRVVREDEKIKIFYRSLFDSTLNPWVVYNLNDKKLIQEAKTFGIVGDTIFIGEDGYIKKIKPGKDKSKIAYTSESNNSIF